MQNPPGWGRGSWRAARRSKGTRAAQSVRGLPSAACIALVRRDGGYTRASAACSNHGRGRSQQALHVVCCPGAAGSGLRRTPARRRSTECGRFRAAAARSAARALQAAARQCCNWQRCKAAAGSPMEAKAAAWRVSSGVRVKPQPSWQRAPPHARGSEAGATRIYSAMGCQLARIRYVTRAWSRQPKQGRRRRHALMPQRQDTLL